MIHHQSALDTKLVEACMEPQAALFHSIPFTSQFHLFNIHLVSLR
jgi:hypothetical protein